MTPSPASQNHQRVRRVLTSRLRLLTGNFDSLRNHANQLLVDLHASAASCTRYPYLCNNIDKFVSDLDLRACLPIRFGFDLLDRRSHRDHKNGLPRAKVGSLSYSCYSAMQHPTRTNELPLATP